ncbi:MAG TPA: HPF/RaiA family ribosome-associated protein [Gammaproteobacteria bacterium]
MKLPLQITFRNMERSDALETKIREHAEYLEKFADNIMSCRVVVEAPHQHQHQGNLFHISIDITVPKHEIAVNRGKDLHRAHEDPYVAVRDAFNAARKQLQELVKIRRDEIKQHDAPPHGRVVSLSPENSFGKIETTDGREIYFHRNSVLDGRFDSLEIGSEVRYHEEMGDQGPQASSVKLIGKHHVVI